MLFFTAAMIESMHKPLIDMSPAHAMSVGGGKRWQHWQWYDERGEGDEWFERSDSVRSDRGEGKGRKQYRHGHDERC
jgi:hypothetical protein